MPAQPVDHPGALADDLIAVVAEHADLQRLLVGERHRETLEPVAQDRQRDRASVDRVALSGLTGDLARPSSHRSRHPDHPFPGSD